MVGCLCFKIETIYIKLSNHIYNDFKANLRVFILNDISFVVIFSLILGHECVATLVEVERCNHVNRETRDRPP